MKKLFLLAAVALVATLGFSQEDDGALKPEPGNFAVTIDASPLIYTVGNFIRIGSDVNFNAVPAIVFKPTLRKMIGYDKALVVSTVLRSHSINVQFPTNTNDPDVTVIDRSKAKMFDAYLGFGLEKRVDRGKRLQVYYGALLGVNYSMGVKITNSFENPLDSGATYSSYITNANYDSYSYVTNTYTSSRPLTIKYPDQLAVGLTPYLGFDIFIFKNISLGGEIGAFANYYWQFSGKQVNEVYDAATGTVIIEENQTSYPSSGFNLDYTLASDVFIRIFF